MAVSPLVMLLQTAPPEWLTLLIDSVFVVPICCRCNTPVEFVYVPVALPDTVNLQVPKKLVIVTEELTPEMWPVVTPLL